MIIYSTNWLNESFPIKSSISVFFHHYRFGFNGIIHMWKTKYKRIYEYISLALIGYANKIFFQTFSRSGIELMNIERDFHAVPWFSVQHDSFVFVPLHNHFIFSTSMRNCGRTYRLHILITLSLSKHASCIHDGTELVLFSARNRNTRCGEPKGCVSSNHLCMYTISSSLYP